MFVRVSDVMAELAEQENENQHMIYLESVEDRAGVILGIITAAKECIDSFTNRPPRRLLRGQLEYS
jgi:hypothetical protein